ncbi:MAG: porin family protein [Gemmatimonadaceae bacterium]
MRIRHTAVVVAALGALLPAAVFAQTKMARPTFGILIGTNIATISDADQGIGDLVGGSFDKKKRIGLDAGVFMKIPLGGMLSLQPEVHYTQNGFSITSSTGDVSSLDLKIDYLQIPVLLRLDAGGADAAVHPILLAGASGSYRLKCSLSGTGGGTSVSTDCNAGTDSQDPFKKSDFSLVGGAGLAFVSMGHSLSLQARYTHGLSSIATNNTATSNPKNRALAVLLGLGF